MNSIFSTGLIEYFTDFKIYIMDGQPFLIQISLRLYVCCAYTSYIVPIIAGVFRRKKTKQFTLQIESCIQIMEQLNIPINLSRCFWQQCYIMLFFVFMIIYVTIFDIRTYMSLEFNYWRIFIFFYLYYYPFVLLSIFDFNFVFWVSQLNDLLKSMLTTTIDSPQHKRIIRSRNIKNNDPLLNNIRRTYKLDDDAMKIKKAREIHLELIKCARNINDVYGVHILFSISAALILITVTSYNMYCFLMTMNNNAQMYRIFVFTHWIVHFTIKIMIISHVCARTMIEIRDFTLQVIQNPLIFTTNGLFNLDHTLIRSVIGTVATYLVILIQVKNVSQQVLIENSTIWTNNYTEN
uniref:Gustatory receptor n=1 Tax=Vespula pensylvanica TaxID=30213 RepID=A0A834PAC3_VESPE|nr:hypothetical protein H0235_002544 [Vespula pensylvanica]